MKAKVFKVRVWTFIKQKRVNSVSFMAKLFGRKAITRGVELEARPDDHFDVEDMSSDGEFEFEEQGSAISRGRASALSSRQLSFSSQLQPEEQPPGPAISKGGAAALSSRRLSFSGQLQLLDSLDEQSEPVLSWGHGSAAKHYQRLSFSGQLQQFVDQSGPLITRGGSTAAQNSRRRSFSGQQQLEQGPASTRAGTAATQHSDRRLSFSGQLQQQPEQDPAAAITKRESNAAALHSRRLSFSGQLQRLEQPPGPAISKGGGAAARGSRRMSFSGQQHSEQGPAISRGGNAALSSRRLSFGGQQDDQGKGNSKRHMQVITMWNPASATSVESPAESSPKIWLKQASKRWREFGSGRKIVDPIENGPETGSRDWRTRVFDIDPDHRWPVQGW